MQNMNIRKSQGGFTLIELVIVIVLLGILAAIALPRYIDLQGEAQQSVVEGAAGALSAAGAINFAADQVNSSEAISVSGTTACATLQGQVSGDVFNDVSIQSDADCSSASAGDEATCTLEHNDDTTRTAVATIICTG